MEQPWIQTYSGKKYPITNPSPEDINIEDISHVLSNICRFSGHVKHFYSVAQHSVLCSIFIADPRQSLEALLHDASEAYLVDVPRPLKLSGVMASYRDLEKVTERVVAERFNLAWPMSAALKQVDNKMLLTEQRDLLGPQIEPWAIEEQPFPFHITAWSPEQSKKEFIERFSLLMEGR